MSKELLNRSFSARLCLRIRPSPPNLRPKTRRKIIAQTSLKSSEYSTTTPTNPPKPSGWSSSSPSEKKTSKLKPDISIALPSTSKKSSATQVLLGDLLSSKESTPPRSTTSSTLGSLSGTLSSRMASRGGPPAFASLNRTSSFAPVSSLTPIIIPPHHLHIYSHKHNTHLTLTTPKRQPLISVSTGNIGFRKSKRGEYDAAYQLAGWVFRTIQDRGLVAEIQKLEVVFRGFGKGRDAVVKALTGVEGRSIRGRVIRVTDASRLKFGGCRSRAPRRL